jgi:hypothetical protein
MSVLPLTDVNEYCINFAITFIADDMTVKSAKETSFIVDDMTLMSMKETQIHTHCKKKFLHLFCSYTFHRSKR